MPQREPQIVQPTPELSPAFRISPCYYDKPGGAKFLLNANVARLGKLVECHEMVSRLLQDPATLARIRDTAKYCEFGDSGSAILHGAFQIAVRKLLEKNTERVRRALQLDTGSLPEDSERLCAADLYGAGLDATWPQIAAARETYQATERMLGYAAAPPDGSAPLTVRHALGEVAAGHVPAPQPEFARAFQHWGAVVLARMRVGVECVG